MTELVTARDQTVKQLNKFLENASPFPEVENAFVFAVAALDGSELVVCKSDERFTVDLYTPHRTLSFVLSIKGEMISRTPPTVENYKEIQDILKQAQQWTPTDLNGLKVVKISELVRDLTDPMPYETN